MTPERPLLSFGECLNVLGSPPQRQTVSSLIKMREYLGNKVVVRMLLGILTHAELQLKTNIIIGDERKGKMIKSFFPEMKTDDAEDDIIKEVQETFIKLTLDRRIDLLKVKKD